MNTTNKPASGGQAPITEAAENTIATLATLMHRSVERLAGLQKAALDTFGNQTADLNKTLRESITPAPPAAVQSLFELAEKNVQGWVDAQKSIVDLITSQSAHVADAAQDGTLFSKPADLMNDLVQKTAERTAEVQKTVLDFAATQNKAVSDVVRKQANVAGKPVASATESLEKAMNQVIDTQKEMVETGAKMLKTAASRV
jgi:hypothetical protein